MTTISEEKSPLSQKKTLIILAISVVLAIVVFLAVNSWLSGPSFSSSSGQTKTTQVLIKVEYDSEWQGAYGDPSALVSWNGNGTKTVTLNKPDTYLWIISANAQKQDDSSKTLTVSILLPDGTVLKTASTTSPYGIAQVTYEIKD